MKTVISERVTRDIVDLMFRDFPGYLYYFVHIINLDLIEAFILEVERRRDKSPKTSIDHIKAFQIVSDLKRKATLLKEENRDGN